MVSGVSRGGDGGAGRGGESCHSFHVLSDSWGLKLVFKMGGFGYCSLTALPFERSPQVSLEKGYDAYS